MAIARPITKTIISTTAWGIPVTDAVNANTTDIAALKPGAWTNLTLQNGATIITSVPPACRRIGDNVQLKGHFANSPPNVSSGLLPTNCRPTTTVELLAFQYNGGYTYAYISISTDGTLKYLNPPGVSANTPGLSLWGLMFPLS